MSSIKEIRALRTAIDPTLKGAKRLADGLSHFKGTEAILPVILIESSVTGGRTYQSYKRGGITEARERFIEQGVSAVVWLSGVKVLNNLIDKIGKKFLDPKIVDLDVGHDVLRNPFKNIVKEKDFTKAAGFQFGKTAISTILATAFIGFILPKMIKNMTKKKMAEENKSNDNFIKNNNSLTMEGFIDKTKKQDITFKGIDLSKLPGIMLNVTDKLQNDTKYRLMSTDVGIITGRTINGRNKYEKMEYLFRDTASVYFYLWCGDHIFKGLSKLTGNTKIHPQASLITANELIRHKDELGQLQDLMKEKVEMPEELFEGSKEDVITFEKFKQYYKGILPKEKMDKALRMTELQPKLNNQRLLSKKEVEDILSNKWTSEPEFLKEVYEQVTLGKSSKANRYVSRKELEETRESIDKFVCDILKCAKNKDENVDVKHIKQVLSKNLKMNSLFTAIGIVVSGFMLSVAIPKIQNYITEKRTGKKGFPGTNSYEKN